MPSPRVKTPLRDFGKTRIARWLLPVALLALFPKCLLCVLAYIGVGAALGLGGPEWCRVVGTDWSLTWMTMLAWAGGAGVLAVLAIRCRRAPVGRPEVAANE